MNLYSNKHFLKYQMDKPNIAHLQRDLPYEEDATKTLLVTKENLLKHERSGVLGCLAFQKSVTITSRMRTLLVRWLFEAGKEFKLSTETYTLTINITDAYLAREVVTKENLQLVGVSAMALASRYLDIYSLELEDYVFVSDNVFTKDDIIRMMKAILIKLGCNINLPNEATYLKYANTVEDSAPAADALTISLLQLSLVEDLDILPSIRVSAIRYIVSLFLQIPFINVFDIDLSYLNFYSYQTHKLSKKFLTSKVDWKIYGGEEWASAYPALCDLVLDEPRELIDLKSRRFYFKADITTPTHLASDAKTVKKLGEGTYGVVKQVVYQKILYASKKHEVDVDNDPITSSFLREVSLLLSLDHPSIMKLKYVANDLSRILIELGDMDLKHYLNVIPSAPKVGEQLAFAKQLLPALVYMHEHGCIHRDIKPQNVILRSDKGKTIYILSDLGSSRGTDIVKRVGPFTHDVCTQWYKSPELLLGKDEYGAPLDIWSMMCLLYEFATKRPLFPGDSDIDQLFKIFMVLGTPDETSWPGVSSLPEYKSTFPKWTYQRNYFDKISVLSDCYKELINTGLVMEPSKRPRAQFLMEIVEDYLRR